MNRDIHIREHFFLFWVDVFYKYLQAATKPNRLSRCSNVHGHSRNHQPPDVSEVVLFSLLNIDKHAKAAGRKAGDGRLGRASYRIRIRIDSIMPMYAIAAVCLEHAYQLFQQNFVLDENACGEWNDGAGRVGIVRGGCDSQWRTVFYWIVNVVVVFFFCWKH